jgi:predicted DNA-binding protein (MmcQ/YjbR family)
MTLDQFRDFCLALPDSSEDMPFGPDVLVMKVNGKLFALTDLDAFESINLKCDPEKAIQLREEFAGVLPGYHMNKKHWNTVMMDGSIPDPLVKTWILESFSLVRGKTKKK